MFQSRHLCVLFYRIQMEKYFELGNNESFDELHLTLGPYSMNFMSSLKDSLTLTCHAFKLMHKSGPLINLNLER